MREWTEVALNIFKGMSHEEKENCAIATQDMLRQHLKHRYFTGDESPQFVDNVVSSLQNILKIRT